MAYADANNANRNAKTLAAVTLLEAGLIWAVITGLANHFVRPAPPKILDTFDVTIDMPKPETRPHEVKAPPIDRKIDDLPIKIDLGTDNTTVTTTAGDLGSVTFPVPDPTPAVTPLRAKPRGNPGLWVTEKDYPTTEIRAEHTGITRVRIAIDAAGKPEGCTVTVSSGWPVLDATACEKITRRASFDPATDSTGARVAGTFATSVNWRLPE